MTEHSSRQVRTGGFLYKYTDDLLPGNKLQVQKGLCLT